MRFHTNLPVSGIASTARFYSTLFDTDPVKQKNDYVKFLPPSVGLNLSFHQNAAGVAKFKELHLGLELPDQASLGRAHERLKAAGLVSAEKDTNVCCYAHQDKFWATDPDGYEWEFYVLLEDTELKIDAKAKARGASGSSTGCC